MKGIILSIKPKWAEAIYDGSKKYEYRRAAPKTTTPLYGLLYEISPVQMITGYALFDYIFTSSPTVVVRRTIDDTPNDRDVVLDYLSGKETGSAMYVDKAEKFDEPMELDMSHPPQNYTYVDITDYMNPSMGDA